MVREAEASIPAAVGRLWVCGAVCRALQESASLLSVHHHHHSSLRFVRNRAGPPPRPVPRCIPVQKWSLVSVCTPISVHLDPPSPALRSSPRGLRCPRPAAGSAVQSDPVQFSFPNLPLFLLSSPPLRRDKVLLVLLEEGQALQTGENGSRNLQTKSMHTENTFTVALRCKTQTCEMSSCL